MQETKPDFDVESEPAALRVDEASTHYVEQVEDTEDRWQARLGHLNYADLRKFGAKALVRGLKITRKRRYDDDD